MCIFSIKGILHPNHFFCLNPKTTQIFWSPFPHYYPKYEIEPIENVLVEDPFQRHKQVSIHEAIKTCFFLHNTTHVPPLTHWSSWLIGATRPNLNLFNVTEWNQESLQWQQHVSIFVYVNFGPIRGWTRVCKEPFLTAEIIFMLSNTQEMHRRICVGI